MKHLIILFSLIFLGLSCSNKSDDGGSTSSGITSAILADPYIFNGVLFWDKNKNSIWDEGEPISEFSDEKGFATFGIEIPKGEIIGQHRAGTMDGFTYPGRLRGISVGNGTAIISPLTTLIANGFTEEEVILIFREVGIDITQEQIYTDPMTDPEVLQSALTLSTALMQNPNRFGITPDDMVGGINGIRFRNNYSQGFLDNAAKIYGDVIEKVQDGNSLENISKTSSGFFDYMTRYGTSDFIDGTDVNPLEVDEAINAISGQFENSENNLQPIVLLAQPVSPTSTFSATVLKNDWFPVGNYDSLGYWALNARSRIVENTIGNYPEGPLELRILFKELEVSETDARNKYQERIQSTNPWNYKFDYNFDPETNQLTLGESLVQDNGDTPENIDKREGLPISSSDYLTTLVYRTLRTPEDSSINETDIFRLVGDGEKIFTHLGVDTGVDPKNELAWRINTSRTNNCLTGSIGELGLTYDCEDPGVTLKYIMAREGLQVHSVESLDQASNRGSAPNFRFSFILKNRSLGVPNSENPREYILHVFSSTEGSLKESSNCSSTQRCLQVDDRTPLENSPDIEFYNGYLEFPSDYKVWAVNQVLFENPAGGGDLWPTSTTSSFYKKGFMVLQFYEVPDSGRPDFEYLILDLATREGVAVSWVKEWEGAKFLYRDFDLIEIKTLTSN